MDMFAGRGGWSTRSTIALALDVSLSSGVRLAHDDNAERVLG